MATFERLLITLDDNLNVKIFSYSSYTKQLALYTEQELIDEASQYLSYY